MPTINDMWQHAANAPPNFGARGLAPMTFVDHNR
jgi:hypothetical protein